MMKEERHSKRRELSRLLMASLEARQAEAGTRLPTIRQLAAQWHVVPLTVERVLNELTESGLLRHEANRGYYLARSFPPKPRIGYLGTLPSPEGHVRERIREEAVRALFDELEKEGLRPELFSYADFTGRGNPLKRLSELNGLLVEEMFYDDIVAAKLSSFKGTVVVLGETSLTQVHPVSYVRTDYRRCLEEFFRMCPVTSWRKHVIVRACHHNALRLSALIQEVLAKAGVEPAEEIELDSFSDAELVALEWFRYAEHDWRNTLLFSLSGYYSRGIFTALHGKGEMPDILSFDNLEARLPLNGGEAYFTSVERNMDLAYRRGVQLLRELIVQRADEVHVIGIHATLILRNSIHGLKPKSGD